MNNANLAQNLSPVGAGTSKAPNKYGTENNALDPYDTIMTFVYHPSAVLRDGEEVGSQRSKIVPIPHEKLYVIHIICQKGSRILYLHQMC